MYKKIAALLLRDQSEMDKYIWRDKIHLLLRDCKYVS